MKVKIIEEENTINFIEVENAMKILAQEGKSIGYDMSECNLLLLDSLQGDFILYLEKPHQNIEDLISNPDKILREGLSINMSDVQIPILKHENKVLVKGDYSNGIVSGSYAYILELVEPKKLMVKLIYEILDNPTRMPPRPITKEDITGITIPDYPAHMEIIRIEDSVEEKRDANEPFMYVEEMPQFPNGGEKALIEFLRKNTRYPELAKNDSIRGSVVITFVIEKDGSIGEIEVLRSLCKSCDEEAIRVVKSMPAWIPGRHNGVNVAVKYTMPVSFSIK